MSGTADKRGGDWFRFDCQSSTEERNIDALILLCCFRASPEKTRDMTLSLCLPIPPVRMIPFSNWQSMRPRSRDFECLSSLAISDFRRSILFNLLNTHSVSAAVQLDADLQDPPELIRQFLEKWERGFKVVYGIRRKRNENVALLWARRLHYRLLRMLSEVEVPVDAGDFRLIDRSVIEHLRSLKINLLSSWDHRLDRLCGESGIVYDRTERVAGKSKFNFFKLLTLSIDGVCSQSTKPLQYITMFGFAVSCISLMLIIMYLFDYIFQYIN